MAINPTNKHLVPPSAPPSIYIKAFGQKSTAPSKPPVQTTLSKLGYGVTQVPSFSRMVNPLGYIRQGDNATYPNRTLQNPVQKNTKPRKPRASPPKRKQTPPKSQKVYKRTKTTPQSKKSGKTSKRKKETKKTYPLLE